VLVKPVKSRTWIEWLRRWSAARTKPQPAVIQREEPEPLQKLESEAPVELEPEPVVKSEAQH
jgi:hypothetical protein